MPEIIFQGSTEADLLSFRQRHPQLFPRIIAALDDLREKGLDSSSLKRLAHAHGIYRKRIGRVRILFTIEANEFHVWIIAIEKDTRKDYQRWIQYVIRHL